MELKDHWEHVFTTKKIEEVSWHEPKPETSLNLFIENNIPKSASILEVGGGDSFLMDFLIEMGYQNLHPCWAEHYESILLDFEEIPSYYIELNIDWYVDKRDFTIRE